ncbi:MAG: molybdopterin molybdenumtransferase MoeA [Nitrospirae bacterium RBG_16_64_22]|nr:MAG: molybdopterin molybdenumtransferase MoeA [Nitrospirae bacterium RBG_16_64_22]
MKDMLGREELVTSAEAAERIGREFSLTGGSGTEKVHLASALGRVLAEDLASPEDLPPFDRSTVDGFALAAADTFGATDAMPAYLKLAGEVAMGERPALRVGKGETVRIWTGGMLPEGTDAAMMLEHASVIDGETVECVKAVAPGENVLFKGEDVTKGEAVLPRGHRLRPQDAGALAGLGIVEVSVFKKPRVAVLSTGDEVVPPEAAPSPGQIRDINAYNLIGLIAEAGGESLYRGIVPDDREALRRAIRSALDSADIVVLSGGSSVGVRDMAPDVLNALGKPGVFLHGVSIRPGKPVLAANVDGKPVFGLPGNPAAVALTFELFVEPVVRRWAGERGAADGPRRTVRARLSRRLASSMGREDYVRVRLEERDGEWWAVPVLGKSGLITTLVRAGGTVVIPLHKTGFEAGETVDVRLFR